MGLKIRDAFGKLFHFLCGNIRGIGDDHVEFSQKGGGLLSRVHRDTADPASQMVPLDILFGHRQGFSRQVRQGHPGILQPAGNGQADAAGAAAQVQNSGVLFQKQSSVDGQLRQGAGIVPGDQHIRGYYHGQTVKSPLPQHIRQWLSPFQPVYPIQDLEDQLFGSFPVPVYQKLFLSPAGKGADQVSGHLPGHLGFLRLQQSLPGAQIKLPKGRYHRSAPSSLGSTAWTAAMPTSIIESSGSLVVKR